MTEDLPKVKLTPPEIKNWHKPEKVSPWPRESILDIKKQKKPV